MSIWDLNTYIIIIYILYIYLIFILKYHVGQRRLVGPTIVFPSFIKQYIIILYNWYIIVFLIFKGNLRSRRNATIIISPLRAITHAISCRRVGLKTFLLLTRTARRKLAHKLLYFIFNKFINADVIRFFLPF